MNICDLDNELFRAINGLAGKYDALDRVGIFLASSFIYLIPAVVILLAWYHYVTAHTRKSRHEAVRDISVMLRAAAAAFIAVVGNFLFSLIYYRERPFVALHGVTRLIGEPLTSKSLPSDHTSMAFAIAVSVTLLHPKLGGVLLAAATGVAVGRIYVGVHFPSDVLAGIFVGMIAAVIARFVGRKLKDVTFIEKELKSLKKMRRKMKR
ncbi:MAG: phosphatase PAP2 family protein [Patescibacteria group bacterium]|nr:phosphatase PAP2 family protein [Patescibacteria group bacterium]